MLFNDYKPATRRIPSQKRRISRIIGVLRLSIWACLSLSLLMVFFCALSYISNSDIFHVKNIRIDGLNHVTDDEVMTMLGIEEGDNIFSWKMDPARIRVKDLPWVEDVSISRRFIPASVTVHITEHIPVASLLLDGKKYLLDNDGEIFAPAEKDFAGLNIRVKGRFDTENREQINLMIRKGMDAVGIMEARNLNVVDLTIDAGGTMDIGLADGLHVVFLGEMSPRKAEMALHTIREVGLMGKKVMDLTCEDKIVLRNIAYGS